MKGMNMEEPERLTATEARGGKTLHIMRYVLGISLVLAVIAMLVVLLGAP